MRADFGGGWLTCRVSPGRARIWSLCNFTHRVPGGMAFKTQCGPRWQRGLGAPEWLRWRLLRVDPAHRAGSPAIITEGGLCSEERASARFEIGHSGDFLQGRMALLGRQTHSTPTSSTSRGTTTPFDRRAGALAREGVWSQRIEGTPPASRLRTRCSGRGDDALPGEKAMTELAKSAARVEILWWRLWRLCGVPESAQRDAACRLPGFRAHRAVCPPHDLSVGASRVLESMIRVTGSCH